jgi:putative ABC transport system permease protein
MRKSPKLPNGVRRLFRLRWSRAHIARDLDDELRFHLEMRMSELELRGMTPPDARIEALRRLGDVDDLRAYCMRTDEHAIRVDRVGHWVAECVHDCRLALRQFRRASAFTALAVLTLALGIGANTAIFSVVHTLLLDPLPYAHSDGIVGLRYQTGDGDMLFPVDGMSIHAWMARARSLEAFSAASTGRVILGVPSDADTVIAAGITPGFLATLNLRPTAGRPFATDDFRSGDPGLTLISDAFWKSRFGGARDAIGSVVRVNGKPRTIIGVMPARTGVPFTHGSPPDIWLPLDLEHLTGTANAFARLRPGVTTDAASRELQAILASSPNAGRAIGRPRAMLAQDFLDRREVRTIEVQFVAVGVLLLIACANVANLLLARSWTRRKEFAIRAALGAGRGRLMRQVLTESTSLAVFAGALGLVIAWATLRIIVGLRPPALMELGDIHLEPAVLGWSALISIATGILFGSIPALVAGSRVVGESLRSAGHAAGSAASRRLRSGLVVLEVGLSVTLLIGAALLVRSFVALQRMPLGYEPRSLISIGTFVRGDDAVRRASIRDETLDRLRALPGVEEAAVGGFPGQGWGVVSPIEVDGNNEATAGGDRMFSTIFVSPGYFRAAGIRMIAGRTLGSSPSEAASEIVVNESSAKKFWPNGHAVGGRIRTGRAAPWSTVVGVVDDLRMPGLRDDGSGIQLYSLPISRIPGVAFVVRSTVSPSVLVPMMRRAIAEAGPDVAVGTATTGTDYLRDSLAPSRFAMALLAAFAFIALVLSAVGLYGVIAYTVTQRTREIGVRIALGADANAVAKLVVGDGLRLALAGVSIGVGAALVSARTLESMLYGVTAADPTSFAAIPALLCLIALIASYVPARRALHIDPVEALRAE